jgi:hypothetical protein
MARMPLQWRMVPWNQFHETVNYFFTSKCLCFKSEVTHKVTRNNSCAKIISCDPVCDFRFKTKTFLYETTVSSFMKPISGNWVPLYMARWKNNMGRNGCVIFQVYQWTSEWTYRVRFIIWYFKICITSLLLKATVWNFQSSTHLWNLLRKSIFHVISRKIMNFMQT